MPGELVSRVGQIQLGSILMGDGTPYVITGARGLVGPAEARMVDTPRAGADGTRVGRDRREARTIEVAVAVVGDDPEQAYSRFAALAAAADPVDTMDQVELAWRLPWGGPRWTLVRPRRAEPPEIEDHQRVALLTQIQFLAPDPGLMSTTPKTERLTLGAGSSSVQRTITQVGSGRAWPTITWSGPTRNPRLTNTTVGRALRIDVDIPVGQQLVVDVRRRRITLAGAPLFSAVRADNEFWQLAAGANQLVAARSTAALTGSAAHIDVAWHDTWAG